MFPPDGLLTSEQTKHDVELNPHIIAPDPFASNDYFDDFSPVHLLLLNSAEKLNTMNPGGDEPSSGLNGRLRPRKSNIPSPQTTKSLRRSSGKSGHDKVKRTRTLSKTPPNKQDDLATKSDTTFLCPYCDRKFASKQSLSKHIRRIHGSSSKQDKLFGCLFCSRAEPEGGGLVRHMAELHPDQYFACLNCHARFAAPSELAEHKIKACELRLPYRSKLRQKLSPGTDTHKSAIDVKNKFGKETNIFSDAHGFNGVVISCELKPSQVSDGADIEDNITTNLILPPSKNLGSNTVVEKNAVIVLDDIQWNKRIPPNFSFHNTDADQILSRLGVVHRSPRTGEPSKKDWKTIDDSTQKFEKCFDTSFYSKVASNVQENISKFLDGSFNFNPDPDSTIKTRKSKNSVVINTAEGFPILLASDQYSRNEFDRYMPRAVAPKHKWKWDNLEAEKSPINPDQIKRDSHTNNCIISLVSNLDIWTQLRMRRKFEEKYGCPPLEKKTEKQTIISNELKDILESRELPATSPPVVKVVNKARASVSGAEFPACLGLAPATPPRNPAPAVLSGEWVRPRCYVCCACGAQTPDSRAACAHGSTQHPNAQVQHYEIVGEQLLNADILKHLYVPPSQMSNRTRPLRGIRECTKCKKSITLEDLHQHMLDCAGDTPAVRRKCRYRPFGVRRRRPRLPDNTIRKKIRKDIRTRQTRPKSLMRPRPIRTEVGDAETIRKMIADLPAKRHRVLVNPNNPSLRPRIKQRPKLLIKGLSSQDRNKRKKRNNKEIAETRSASPTNDDTSSKSDEDKPLKPKIKRLVRKTARPIDTDKTKTKRLNRPKRKNIQAKEPEKNDDIKETLNPNYSSKGVMTDMSLEKSPKKIDIQAADFKAREHVGRGNSSNRDGQRPGCSGENANSQNRCAPVQNVPLKHSIARLTADSEKHDKSVQFHHLFLVQQECNNVNQHVNSGQQLLFENEAAVLTLDKPPLHYSSTAPLDVCSSQKNKLNKPRKGLNACIAMLKNKLVEPATSASIPTGHVSVQCGDDEPLYIKPDTTPPEPVCSEPTVEISKADQLRETIPNKKTALEPKRRRAANQEKKYGNVEAENTVKPSTSSYQAVTSKQKSQNVVAKRESSRRRSLVNEAKATVMTSQCDLLPQREVTELVSPKPNPPKNIPIVADASPHKGINQQNDQTSSMIIQTSEINKDKEHIKSIERRQSNQQINKPHSLGVQEKEVLGGHIISPRMSTEVNESLKQVQSNDYYDSCLNLQQQTEFQLECDYNRKMLSENYPGTDLALNQMPVNIRPAHASTNVESIVSIPLDLSGKTSMNNLQDFSNHENAYLLRSSYDTYETLDLSNKNQDLFRPDINLPIPNEIVDLSIKTSHSKSSEVDATVKDVVTDLSLTNVNNDVPTDLTVKKISKKTLNKELEIKTDVIDTRVLNKVMNLDMQVQGRDQSEIEFNTLTGLSENESKTQSMDLTSGAAENQSAEKLLRSGSTGTHQLNTVPPSVKVIETIVENIPADLRKEPKPTDRVPKYISSDLPSTISQVPESASKNLREVKVNQEQNCQSKHLRTCEKSCLPIQKPVYDPTLKIPQYKIRAVPANDAPANTDITTSLANATPLSTCAIVPNNTATAAIPSQDVFANTLVGKPSMGTQEPTFSYASVQSIAPNSNAGSMFSISNTGKPSQLGKFESTTAVYTLANACISVTKIETSNSTSLTNTLLSIPGTTIANTTPVYTLAGTTIGVPGKYSHVVPESPSSAKDVKDTVDRMSAENHSESPIESTSGQNSDLKERSVSKEFTNDTHMSFNVGHDPETARKIALLPKELIDILGNMPVDHRNQLLNVLPQYVSTATSVPDLQSDLPNNSDLPDKIKTLPSIDQLETTLPNVGISMQEPEAKNKSSHYIEEQDSHMRSMKSVALIHSENTSSATLVKPIIMVTQTPIILNNEAEKQEPLNTQQLRSSKEEPQVEAVKVKPDVISEESFGTLSLNRLPVCHDYSTNKVIDLTEDENTPRAEIRNEPPVEVSTHISVLVQQPKRNKSNNDQTASLRAVRIKAPSERQRSVDNQLVKQSTLAPVPTSKLSNDQDNEAKKSLHINVSLNTDVSLAIQQAEVSSTQHTNKNAIPECKFPSAISPNVQESNAEEMNNCSLTLMSTASKDEIIKNDDMQNVPLNSVAKSTLVTSSIINNTSMKTTKAIDKTPNLLNTDFATAKYVSKEHVMSSESGGINKEESSSLTESSIQNVSDISESCELDAPIRCSTPNAKSVLDSQNERILNPINHSWSNTGEEQEDSDDNLSLAVICKQKQQNLQNENVSQKKSNTVRKRVKKNKKKIENDNQKSVSLREESICNNNTLLPIITHKNNEQTSLTDISDASSKTAEDDMQSKSSTMDQSLKDKVSKVRNSIVIINKGIDASEKMSNVTLKECGLYDKTKTSEISSVVEAGVVEVERSDNNDIVLENEQKLIVTTRKRFRTYDNTDITNASNIDKSVSKSVSLRQKNKKKKKTARDVSPEESDKDRVDQKEEIISKLIKGNETKGADIEETKPNMPDTVCEQTLNTKESSKQKDCGVVKSPENILIDSNSQITDNSISTSSRPQEPENKNSPLRRSRRGKSLSNSVGEEELLHTETSLESKTPLTKKQLIFSKLLLDEENNLKAPDSVSENKISIVHVAPQNESKFVENIIIDKHKSSKRKKSPHLKRKYKKKKIENDDINCDEEVCELPLIQTKPAEVTSQMDNNHSKSFEHSSDQSDCGVSGFKSVNLTTADTETSLEKEKSLIISIEKRKSNELASAESLQCTLLKKSKLNKDGNSFLVKTPSISQVNEVESNAQLESDVKAMKQDTKEKEASVFNVLQKASADVEKSELISVCNNKVSKESDLRVKTCYNTPVAAGRRTRSKSAVIQSAVYDPYDIDMDDMIEHAEPLRQSKISVDQKSSCSTKHQTCLKETQDFAIKEKKKEITSHGNEEKERNMELISKNYSTDSDDSSKSDIPLNKYVEEKEKKNCELVGSRSNPKSDVHIIPSTDVSSTENKNRLNEKRNKRPHEVCNSGEGVTADQTEEQLRSEQFMESFGFFSERKPRKSNLLATKKISETFHIIANECDDIYFGFKERNSKKSVASENRKSIDDDSNVKGTRQRSPLPKKSAKRGRKKKTSTITTTRYCDICKKQFHRPDNFVRHQMTLLHVSKVSEVEMKLETISVQEEPNYLLAYKEHLDRIKAITDKITKRKKNSKSGPKVAPLSLEEILGDVKKIVREQQLSLRGLSCDEELFLDCCELLKESHKKPEPVADTPSLTKNNDSLTLSLQSRNVGLDLLGKSGVDTKSDNKNDGDVDSITAKSILESEEVRNLENDLISGLKEAANASNQKSSIVYQHTVNDEHTDQHQEFSDNFSSPAATESHYDQLDNYEEPEELNIGKTKKYPEFKEKMYPDIEEIDMFEDKFDKIKRKCRSQAAAAKQTQHVIEPNTSRKGRKKSDKKKGKKSSKKIHSSTVLTKGALKGFDGIKVSIPTSDINIAAIVSPLGTSHKKRKKGSSKKRRENKISESSSKYDSDHPANDGSASMKNVDVYEFMDNEDVELFEFRPSTLMERFKSISNKETPSTSKVVNPVVEEAENSSTSASDGDDFVYMSDDYVCSDDETENSLMSCDASNTKVLSDTKKLLTHIKRRDVVEKNAVMGKIFKNNAVRSEKKMTKSKEPQKPKANLDQLFDSLLEDEPSSSMLNDDSLPLKDEVTFAGTSGNSSPNQSESLLNKYEQQYNFKKNEQSLASKENYASLKQKTICSDNEDETSSLTDYGPSTSKISMKTLIGVHKSIRHRKRHSSSPVSTSKYDVSMEKPQYSASKKLEKTSLLQDDFSEYQTGTPKIDTELKINDSQSFENRSPIKKLDNDTGISCDYNESYDQISTADETGVARQRARRKCTVGKQNVLAETWSSESEPDGGPPRSHSAESLASGTTRKKKGKKKDGHQSSSRRGRHISFRKQDIESRVTSSNRNTTTQASGAGSSGVMESRSAGSTNAFAEKMNEASTSAASALGDFSEPATASTSASAPSAAAGAAAEGPATFLVPAEPAEAAPSGKGRFHTVFYWSPEGHEQQQQQQQQQQLQQQHGWIVGDSHKKLVTMLAHAKGRKRNHDDKRHLVE